MPSSSNTSDLRRLRLTNNSASELDLGLEPLGDRLKMAAGKTYEVHFIEQSTAQASDCVEVSVGDKTATIYGWLKSIFVIHPDGRQTEVWPTDDS